MKHVEVTELLEAVPIPVKMDRSEKIRRWADLVSKHPGQLALLHGLEYMHPRDLERIRIRDIPPTALAVAASDPTFQQQGLSAETTIGGALRFFETSQQQAHAFACDCLGDMTNDAQAFRISRLA